LAAFYVDDPRHEASIYAIGSAASACCASESLSELYAALTRLPVAMQPPPEAVAMYIESLLERVSAVALTDTEVADTVRLSAASRAAGPALYNALQLRAAEKAGASRFFTWSVPEFIAVAGTPSLKILTPDHA